MGDEWHITSLNESYWAQIDLHEVNFSLDTNVRHWTLMFLWKNMKTPEVLNQSCPQMRASLRHSTIQCCWANLYINFFHLGEVMPQLLV